MNSKFNYYRTKFTYIPSLTELSFCRSEEDFVLCFLCNFDRCDKNPFGNDICLPYKRAVLGFSFCVKGLYSTSTSNSLLFNILPNGITTRKKPRYY